MYNITKEEIETYFKVSKLVESLQEDLSNVFPLVSARIGANTSRTTHYIEGDCLYLSYEDWYDNNVTLVITKHLLLSSTEDINKYLIEEHNKRLKEIEEENEKRRLKDLENIEKKEKELYLRLKKKYEL